MANLFPQILGVRGQDLATRRGNVVTPANFGIAGMMGHFQRRYAKAFLCTSPTQFTAIFGGYFSPAAFGPDVVNDFFNNLAGTAGSVMVAAYVGNSGGTIDAVVATIQANDGESPTPQQILQFDAAYQGISQYGTDGNKTGYTIVRGNRFATTVIANGTAPQTVLSVASIADISVGDIVKVTWTGGTPGSGGRKVVAIDQGLGTITLDTNLGAGNFVQVGDAVEVPGFQVHVWRKDQTGATFEVEADLAAQWCTTMAAVSDHYVNNVFARSSWVRLSALTITPPVNPVDGLPAAQATIVYLAAGADGTQPTGTDQSGFWTNTLHLFDNQPVRFLGNTESPNVAVQKAGEAYCSNRWDTPCWLLLISANQSLAQAVVTGNGFQRSGKVSALGPTTGWGYKTDPYQSNPAAPFRAVPPIGAVAGLYIRIINKYGIHYTPGIQIESIVGWQDVYGEQALDDIDRTTLANAGVNAIQNLSGIGIVLRNAFTPSSTIDYVFVNGLVMGNYIKVSSQGSLATTENLPLTFAKLQADRSAIDMFMRNLWRSGSTGNVPEGETFGGVVTQRDDGSLVASTYQQSVSVEANLANNPQSQISSGNEQIWVYFMRPAPAGSIRIGVGIQLAA